MNKPKVGKYDHNIYKNELIEEWFLLMKIVSKDFSFNVLWEIFNKAFKIQ